MPQCRARLYIVAIQKSSYVAPFNIVAPDTKPAALSVFLWPEGFDDKNIGLGWRDSRTARSAWKLEQERWLKMGKTIETDDVIMDQESGKFLKGMFEKSPCIGRAIARSRRFVLTSKKYALDTPEFAALQGYSSEKINAMRKNMSDQDIRGALGNAYCQPVFQHILRHALASAGLIDDSRIRQIHGSTPCRVHELGRPRAAAVIQSSGLGP